MIYILKMVVEGLTTITWYGVEFLCYICIIAYTLAYFGIIKGPRVQGNRVEDAGEAWGQASGILQNVATVTKSVAKAFENSPEQIQLSNPGAQPQRK